MEILNLITEAKNNNSQAFGEIYDLFAAKIFRFIKLKIQNQQQAEDILQETFIKAWRALPQYKEDGNFSAWLYRIAANTINDYFRKFYRSPQIMELNEDLNAQVLGSAAGELDRQLEMEIVKKAFTELPVNYRQVLELRFVQDFSISETAEILGKSNLSIRLVQHRALAKLKIILANNAKMPLGALK